MCSSDLTTGGRRRHRVQAALVVTTVVLACELLVGAGLFLRSFSALMATDAGFNPDRVLTASVMLPPAGYGTATRVRAFHDALLGGAMSLPDVRSAALMTDLPLERYERRVFTAERAEVAREVSPTTDLSWIDGSYFQTLGIRVTRGRAFSDVERSEPRDVVVVNERLARTVWPGQDPLGQRLRWGGNGPQNPNHWLTIVGVIANVADGRLGQEPFMHAYEPFSQFPNAVLDRIPSAFGRQIKVAVRTDVDPRRLVSSLRTLIGSLDPQLAIESIAPMDDRVGDVVAPRRFSVWALGVFATGSLLLAATGLYGLLAFTVAERRREIAVRLALGAERRAILRMIIGRGLALVSIGIIVGVVASYVMTRAVVSLLYGTDSHDLLTFSAVPLMLVMIALLACALPAYRASRLNPAVALKNS